MPAPPPDPDPDDADPLADVALEHRRIETNGVDLHVVAAGPDDGPLVVLLHGFPEFWYGWRRTIPALVDRGFRVLAPDQRGYNTSEKPGGIGAYALDELRDDVCGLIDAAGRDRAHVVGHDWGAMVAWYLAMTSDRWVDRLVTINVPHPLVYQRRFFRDPRQMVRSLYAGFFQIPWLSDRLVAARDYAYLVSVLTGGWGDPGLSDRELDRYREAYARPGAVTAMLNWYRAAVWYRPDPPDDPTIDPPTLLIWGEKDAALRAVMAPESIDLCADGRLASFPDASHWIVHEKPAVVNDLIVEHLDGA